MQTWLCSESEVGHCLGYQKRVRCTTLHGDVIRDIGSNDCHSGGALMRLKVILHLCRTSAIFLFSSPCLFRAIYPLAGTPYDTGQRSTEEDVLCLLLVASRDIKDEELLLNYRLSPGAATPDWYEPVDPVEAKRRWA